MLREVRRSDRTDRKRSTTYLQGAGGLVNRLAHALVKGITGVKPGNRILIRSEQQPALVAAWLATKAGAVVVNTMPMLRAGELTKIVDKAEIARADRQSHRR